MAKVVTVGETEVIRLAYPDGPVVLIRANQCKGTYMRLEIQAPTEILIERVGRRPLSESLKTWEQ